MLPHTALLGGALSANLDFAPAKVGIQSGSDKLVFLFSFGGGASDCWCERPRIIRGNGSSVITLRRRAPVIKISGC
jgi:hypothetical protein